MNVAGINFESVADGEGVRVVIYISGCLHNCKGCHNPASHSFTAGQPFSEKLQDDIICYIQETPFVSGMTLSGGDPLYSAKELTDFLAEVRRRVPNISIWLYSGFVYEDAISDPDKKQLIQQCDVMVDGEFILEQRDMTLSYRGSRNQRIIDISASLEAGEAVTIAKE